MANEKTTHLASECIRSILYLSLVCPLYGGGQDVGSLEWAGWGRKGHSQPRVAGLLKLWRLGIWRAASGAG